MLQRCVINPNLGKAPVVTTTQPAEWGEPMLGLLPRFHTMKPLAALLTPEEVEFMVLEYPTIAPPLLMQFLDTSETGGLRP
jgi:hypothetical protein